ncbi:PD-(D/E)XK nuclease family protein [Senegalimassilia anaerobia]|uniref:PD-(D/E)XK nuclease family protein n=1 Tax=Senegalimassilia anaerobia TaxID=1473216 RepID=UPI0026F1222A|nr:PD-(D/E)XK nuclease family protein [Senegalimassilia anaerobia]
MDTSIAYDVVLLPDTDRAVAYRKRAADSGCSLMGVTVAAFGAWVRDLWELYGDGRTFVSRLEREALLRAACERPVDGAGASAGAGETGALGLDRVAAACVAAGVGLPAFDAAVQDAQQGVPAGAGALEGVSCAEVPVLRMIGGYLDRLAQLGMIEPGQALALLPELLPQRPLRVLLEDAAPLTPGQEAFFSACPWMDMEVRAASGSQGPVRAPEGVRVRFAFPSGQYAWPALLADIVRDALGTVADRGAVPAAAAGPAAGDDGASSCEDASGSANGYRDGRSAGAQAAAVVVAAKDPAVLFGRVAPALVRQGHVVALRGRRRFADTAFGRVICSLRRFLDEGQAGGASHIEGYGDIAATDVERWNRADLADWALSPFSGMTKKAAFKLDADMRADRTARRSNLCARLRADNPMFAAMERLALQLDDQAAAELEAAVRRMTNRSEAWRAEQLAALRALQRAAGAAKLAGLGADAAFDQVQRLKVSVSRIVAPRGCDGAAFGAPDVLVTDQSTAASLGSGSCEVCVVADLTSGAYPAADPEDASRVLLEHLGVKRADSALARMRRVFFALEHAATDQLILERCLNDSSADPTYPCVVLEEFVDCYRDDPTATEDIDNPYSLPERLQDGMLLRGEDALCSNDALSDVPAPETARIEPPLTGAVSAEARSLVVLPRVLQGGQVLDEPCLSPSQIESYLECPYKWFAQRRLRLDDLDEGFGPLEMGDFAHNALHSFYKHMSEDLGEAKVTPQLLPQARKLMADVLARHKALQPHLRQSENRLIPTSQVEHRELAELERKLMDYLDFEAELLPTFAPKYLEYDVACGGAVDYAGHKLLGTADRIDVDGEGRCAIIDYKGSISGSYALGVREEGRLGKVQALIYAQVVRRTLGLEPVGALYVCYGRRKMISGAYDGRVIENAHLPNMRHKDCMCADRPFSDVLDETEEAVAAALERMLAGDIRPRPETPEACKWCPVSSCPERRG